VVVLWIFGSDDDVDTNVRTFFHCLFLKTKLLRFADFVLIVVGIRLTSSFLLLVSYGTLEYEYWRKKEVVEDVGTTETETRSNQFENTSIVNFILMLFDIIKESNKIKRIHYLIILFFVQIHTERCGCDSLSCGCVPALALLLALRSFRVEG
jgi:hypothetical protein